MDYLYNLFFKEKKDNLLTYRSDSNLDNNLDYNYEGTCTYHNLDTKTRIRKYYKNEFYDYNLKDNQDYSIKFLVNSNIKNFKCKYYEKSSNLFYLKFNDSYHFNNKNDKLTIKVFKKNNLIHTFKFNFVISDFEELTDILCVFNETHKLFFYFKKNNQNEIFYLYKFIYMKL